MHFLQEAYDVNDTFKVQYTRNKSVDVSDSQKEIKEGEKTDRQSSIEPPSSELAQLQVLHRARGRKLEELSTELALKEKGYERQIRILDHQLSLVKGTPACLFFVEMMVWCELRVIHLSSAVQGLEWLCVNNVCYSTIHPPIYPPIQLPTHIPLHPFTIPASIHPPTHPPTHSFIHPFTIHPSIHPSIPIYLPTHLPTHLPTRIPIHPPTHPSTQPPNQPPTQTTIHLYLPIDFFLYVRCSSNQGSNHPIYITHCYFSISCISNH